MEADQPIGALSKVNSSGKGLENLRPAIGIHHACRPGITSKGLTIDTVADHTCPASARDLGDVSADLTALAADPEIPRQASEAFRAIRRGHPVDGHQV